MMANALNYQKEKNPKTKRARMIERWGKMLHIVNISKGSASPLPVRVLQVVNAVHVVCRHANFDVICDPFLKRRMSTWNLLIKYTLSQYIGETKQRLKDRFYEHRRPIDNSTNVSRCLQSQNTSSLTITPLKAFHLFHSNSFIVAAK